jgi:hypothetical protein
MYRFLSNLSGSRNYHAIQLGCARQFPMAHPVDERRYKLVYFTPVEPSERIKEAIFATGAGTIPGSNYTKVRLSLQTYRTPSLARRDNERTRISLNTSTVFL